VLLFLLKAAGVSLQLSLATLVVFDEGHPAPVASKGLSNKFADHLLKHGTARSVF
jgi:hypothetical protein